MNKENGGSEGEIFSNLLYEADEELFCLLGAALYGAQRIEYCLYGIVSHVSHIPEAQKEKRFRELTPEKFLRGGGADIKATLGQIIENFGDTFLIKTDDLIDFYKERNYIVHDYFRAYMTPSASPNGKEEGKEFIRSFLEKLMYWEPVVRGLLYELMMAMAVKFGRESEINFNAVQLDDLRKFREHVSNYIRERSNV